MVASDFDILTVAAFAAAIFISRQAVILLASHLALEVIYLLPLNDFWATLASAALYSAAASVFVRLKSSLRYVMLCIASLYYIGAIDAFLFPTIETVYYNSISYLIGALDLCALIIVCYGGRAGAGIVRPSDCWIFRLQSV